MSSLLKILFNFVFWFEVIQTLIVKHPDLFLNKIRILDNIDSFFNTFDTICVKYSHLENQELLDITLQQLSTKQIDLIIAQEFFYNVMIQCRNILVLDLPGTLVCDLFTGKGKAYLGFKHKILFGYFRVDVNFRMFKSCSSVFEHAQVKVFSSLNERTLKMTSPFSAYRGLVADYSKIPSGDSFLTNFEGKYMGLATFHFPPFSIIIKRSENSEEYDGMEMALFQHLSQLLNFTWGLVRLKEPKQWGIYLDNGSFVGGVGQAIREDADVVFDNYWQRLDSLFSMDYGPTLNQLRFTFLVRRPHREYSRWHSLFTVFSTKVLIITLGAFTSATLTFWFGRIVYKHPSRASLSESALIMFGMLTLSSVPPGPPRGLLFCWSLFSLLFSSALMGSVVPRLAVPLFADRVDTVRQAVEGGYHWINPEYHHRATYLESFMFNMDNPWQKQFAAKYTKNEPEDVEELLNSDSKVMLPVQRWGDDFVIMNIPGVTNFTYLQDFRAMRETTRDVFTSFALKKGSPLNELLAVGTETLVDRGLWDYCKRTQTSKGEFKRSRQLMEEKDLSVLSQPEPFTLIKLYPVFVLLAVGNSLAFLVFLLELWWTANF